MRLAASSCKTNHFVVSGVFLDLDTWHRRSQFEFYRAFDQPFFSIVAEVCVTDLFRRTSEPGGPSFFLATLYHSLHAANQIEEFRLRLRPDGVWKHDRIHAGSTLLRADETFGFGYFDFAEDYREFERRGRNTIQLVKQSLGALDPQDERDDLIHYSVLPWIRFTSFSHARKSNVLDSVPKIVFGRRNERDGGVWMPVSVEVHHALVDGLHVARFLEAFQAQLRSDRLQPNG
jgi:chloramphenicol O-acetyltransferase type A